MTKITDHPMISGAAFLEVEATKLPMYAATHDLLTPEVIDLLQVGQMADLTVSLHETGVYLGIHDPTVTRHPRLIFAAGVFHIVMISERKVWASTEKVDDLRPVRGLFVPGGVAVGLQAMHNNRCSYFVLGHRNDVPQIQGSFKSARIARQWQRVGNERIHSVISGKRLP